MSESSTNARQRNSRLRYVVSEPVLSPLFAHYLLLLLSLLQEFQLGNDPRDLSLIDNVHLRDVKHYKEEVQLAHGCILKHDEWSDVLQQTASDIFIIEVDGRIPESLQLILLPVELHRCEDRLQVLTSDDPTCILRFLFLFSLVETHKLGNLELFVVCECNERLQYFCLAIDANGHFLLLRFVQVFSQSETV